MWDRVLNCDCTSRALREFGHCPVDVEKVIGRTLLGFEQEVSYYDASMGRDIGLFPAINHPAPFAEQLFHGFSVFRPRHPESSFPLWKSLAHTDH